MRLLKVRGKWSWLVYVTYHEEYGRRTIIFPGETSASGSWRDRGQAISSTLHLNTLLITDQKLISGTVQKTTSKVQKNIHYRNDFWRENSDYALTGKIKMRHLCGIFKHCVIFFRSCYFAYLLLWRIKMLHTINHWKYPGKNMNNNQKKSANGRWSQSGPFFAIDYHQWKWSCSSAGGILVVFWIYWSSRMCLLLYLLFRFVCIYADKCPE